MTKKVFLILIILTCLILLKIIQNNLGENRVCFGSDCFYVELAETKEERALGLMFGESLDSDRGMLFIFDEEGEYSFWMKNTLIPLDIIWINSDKEVVYISKNTQPCGEECKSVIPVGKAKYVLEINGGIADKIGIGLGDRLTFHLK